MAAAGTEAGAGAGATEPTVPLDAPWVYAFLVGLAPVLLVGGSGALVVREYRRRDPDVGPVPPSLSEPPSDLAPGLAGALAHRGAETDDLLATLVDLARRGFLQIRELTGGLRRLGRRDFLFVRGAGDGRPLGPHEGVLLAELFDGSTERRASELGGNLRRRLPQVRPAFVEELVRRGLAGEEPTAVRERYRWAGAVLCIFGIGGVLLSGGRPTWETGLFAGVFILSVATGLIERVAVRRTPAGAEEAARWRAFRAYLEWAPHRVDERIDGARFERYLPYAVAFGSRGPWLEPLREGRVDGWAPSWYVPIGESSGPPGAIAGGGAAPTHPSPRELGAGLARLLEAASDAIEPPDS